MEKIVAAAISIEGVILSLPKPARHGHIMASANEYVTGSSQIVTAQQGFLTSEGRFVNRIAARQIAYLAGQEPIYSGQEGSPELFSEDLW